MSAESMTNQSLFASALDARVALATANVLRGHDHYRAYMEEQRAFSLARDAGRRFPHEPMPLLLVDHPLFEAWMLGRNEAVCEAQEAAEATRIEQALAAKNWAALAMPTPTEVVQKLRAGESFELNGHTLEFEEDLEVVWVTNPYGIDGAFSDEASEAEIERFLTDMARGVTYGPTP